VGVLAGYLNLSHAQIGISYGIPVGVEYSSYIESGWEWVTRLNVMLLQEPNNGFQVFSLWGLTGARYLFLQEHFRPYAGAGIGYLHTFSQIIPTSLVGIGPNVGFDVFVSESMSVGLRGEYHFYWWPNTEVRTVFGVLGGFRAYF
jgi:outer membrane protein